MKSFQEFLEQVETAQQAQKTKMDKNKALTMQQRKLSYRHHIQTHNELKSKAAAERDDMVKRMQIMK
jgi:hypothetical protein